MKDFLFYGRIRQTQTTIINKMNNIDNPPYIAFPMKWISIYPKEMKTASELRTIVQEVFDKLPNVRVNKYEPSKWIWNWEYGSQPMEEQMQKEHGYSAVYNRVEAIHSAILLAQKKFPHNLEYDDDGQHTSYEPYKFPIRWSVGRVEIGMTDTGPIITLFKTEGDGSSFILFNAIEGAVNR